MTVGLFIPCYIDQFYPQVGIATLELLARLGFTVVVPPHQTCCGQPMANAGVEQASEATHRHFVSTFAPFDHIVSPSGSCIHHVREQYAHLPDSADVRHVRSSAMELAEFLVTVAGIEDVQAEFPHRVGLHQSCHGLRGLRTGSSSELQTPKFSYAEQLLRRVKGLTLTELDRVDECCGFGGLFSVTEEAVSVSMGKDRISDHQRHTAEVITSSDMSCLMHMEGIIRRQNLPVTVKHIAEILNSRPRM